jgi:hypothetical protein
MIYAVVPVINGEPNLDWSKPPIESFQLSETERYCKFPSGTAPQATWQIIAEAEYEAARPVAPVPVPEPLKPTLQDLQDQINVLGQGMVQLLLQGGGV